LVWVCEHFEEGQLIKSQLVLVLLRGDHELNEIKLAKCPLLNGELRLASSAEIESAFGCVPGYLGPLGAPAHTLLLVDSEVAIMSDWVCGANLEGHHVTGVNWTRDLELDPSHVFDLRNVVAGDLSPDGKGTLSIERGIEVGHIFYLGTKYSKAMDATFLDENGKPQPFEMGCYGIGITRLPAAAIEQNHDEKGIIWPDAIAPFVLVICPIGMDRSEPVQHEAQAIYEEAKLQGWDVILDDRGERPGVMFADWELIGVPHRVVISERGLKAGQVEYQHRRDQEASNIALSDLMDHLKTKIKV
jgi:prolyl-tRNA synthetase